MCTANQLCSAAKCISTGITAGGAGGGGAEQNDAGVGGGTSASGGGLSTGGGTASGGGITDPTLAPIVAPNETWTFIDFPNSTCGNGMPTGIGVNLTTRSTDVLIYLQGGGACWDSLTCFLANAAAHIQDGYTAQTFASDNVASSGLINRVSPAHPFKDMNGVYVPYCTGDVHAGDNVKTYMYQGVPRTVHHTGAKNLAAYLLRLKATFPNATRVFLLGSSAGAYGAQLSYEQVAKAFPAAQVHSLADCGQMVTPNGTRLTSWLESWNLSIPTACTDCTTDFSKFPAYLMSTYPTKRFGLMAYQQDQTLRTFSGYDGPTYQMKTDALITAAYQGKPNGGYYVLAGNQHVMLGNLFTLVSPAPTNVPLLNFVNQWIDGTMPWVSVKP
jgi:hypothetical protein